MAARSAPASGTNAGDRSSCDIDIRRAYDERLDFHFLRQSFRGDTSRSKSAGWLKSAVLQRKAFRLTRQLDDLEHPDFILDMRSIGFPIRSEALIVLATLVEEAGKP